LPVIIASVVDVAASVPCVFGPSACFRRSMTERVQFFCLAAFFRDLRDSSYDLWLYRGKEVTLSFAKIVAG
jgi:hypothetical protein